MLITAATLASHRVTRVRDGKVKTVEAAGARNAAAVAFNYRIALAYWNEAEAYFDCFNKRGMLVATVKPLAAV